MTKRMLIDAAHPEETRVVLVDGNKIDDFDLETASKKHLKGNIYLARITRVEPSLQAAFVEYGGNRHGFMAFTEVHPDYYRIPIDDREVLISEEQTDNTIKEKHENMVDEDAAGFASNCSNNAEENKEVTANISDLNVHSEIVSSDNTMDNLRSRRQLPSRRYKIHEVVARRQIMLVQVIKESRGNKGAALTTYLSLAGRYCVLMPNTDRGGGVSRKITHVADRKRLKQIVDALNVPEGMTVIVRTAGAQRTKAEIKRDYEYLLRLWDEIRKTTLDSTAPCLIYEEANLIKRSIRDLYTRDLDEVLVDGDDGYKTAKDFMKTMIPSHAKRVKRYNDPHVPLLHRFQLESQLDAIHNPIVDLKSGGYIVMNQTEALVAIDVNSGRSTSERSIEETALKTNLEAADEVARQLRLRDLAGLVVIDFIDVEESRNQRAVERRMKEAIKADRARIQIGRISHFGLMGLSRQRLRPSLVEASTQICLNCKGLGYIRSIDSTALHILRVIEEEGLRNRAAEIVIHVPGKVALYILNQKRNRLADIELRYGNRVFLEQDATLVPPDYRLERLRSKTAEERAAFQIAISANSAEIDKKDNYFVLPDKSEIEDFNLNDECNELNNIAQSCCDSGDGYVSEFRDSMNNFIQKKDNLLKNETSAEGYTEVDYENDSDYNKPRFRGRSGRRRSRKRRDTGSEAILKNEKTKTCDVSFFNTKISDKEGKQVLMVSTKATKTNYVYKTMSDEVINDEHTMNNTDLEGEQLGSKGMIDHALVFKENSKENKLLNNLNPKRPRRRRRRSREEILAFENHKFEEKSKTIASHSCKELGDKTTNIINSGKENKMVSQELNSTGIIQIKNLNSAVENPRKGWWRR
ncbi:ribonuclease, Rne/Rng family domain protein [Candidatus Endolissoclinum faulkneri L2]|uniref:Ribonuclease, Rne/Rng family domain protein n=1 Tax=Candidatus Endolissoclinum faulkneri L2 TaxID=1193729 RepID=K7YQ01_9PROT|nr:ribonuclease E/G [Candidatus Endolissoclinum faulkneri]AFX98659.1 ribonuclease, Rne/Rng family domain protein [Candidatus Endolissoclinum faulkneri L2]